MTTTETKKTTEPVIRWKLLKNVHLHLPNLQIAQPKHTTRQVKTSIPIRGRKGEYHMAQVAEFDMEHAIFESRLLDERPWLPSDIDQLSPAMKAEAEREAFAIAAENRKKNNELRKALNRYAEDTPPGPFVEIMSDEAAIEMKPMSREVK
jgi:hypothetical protein